MTLNKIAAALFVVLVTSVAFAKDRYVVIYKSKQGFTAMNSFMKLESGKKFGLNKSLPYIKGMVLKNVTEQAVESLRKHPEVLLVEKEILFPGPKPVNGFTSKKMKTTYTPTTFTGDITTFKVGELTPWGITAVNAEAAWIASPDAGSSARVLVLDSGLDTTHAALSSNFEKGQNFYDADTAGEGTFVDNVGHGTHVAGTIAAQYNEQTGFVGVAPNAKILMGKVCETFCNSVGIAEGINWGVQEKVDVINMSLGGAMTSLGVMAAVQAAENAGVFIAAASGNGAEVDADGFPTTPGVSYPAALPTVFAVGAVDSQLVRSTFSNWGPELAIVAPGSSVYSTIPVGTGREALLNMVVAGVTTPLKGTTFSGASEILQLVSGAAVSAGLGKPDDYVDLDVTGKIAIISRGEITFREKVLHAQAAGAVGAVIFNNVSGMLAGTLVQPGDSPINFPVLAVEQSEGLKLVGQLAAGEAINIELQTLVTDYAVFDGTSMATPHVAGVAALVISAYKKAHVGASIAPAQLRAVLKNTAKTLAPNIDNQYGSGLIQADAAISEAVTAP